MEVCGRAEREKLVSQSCESVPQRTCESTQGTEATGGCREKRRVSEEDNRRRNVSGGCHFGLLQAVRRKLGVPRENSVWLPAQPQLVGVAVLALLATVSAE